MNQFCDVVQIQGYLLVCSVKIPAFVLLVCGGYSLIRSGQKPLMYANKFVVNNHRPPATARNTIAGLEILQ